MFALLRLEQKLVPFQIAALLLVVVYAISSRLADDD